LKGLKILGKKNSPISGAIEFFKNKFGILHQS